MEKRPFRSNVLNGLKMFQKHLKTKALARNVCNALCDFENQELRNFVTRVLTKGS